MMQLIILTLGWCAILSVGVCAYAGQIGDVGGFNGGSAIPPASSSGGTVTSLTCGTGLTCSPNSITTTGSLTPLAATGFELNSPADSSPVAVQANKIQMGAVLIPAPITFSKISIRVQTPDNSNNSDACLYNSAGTLIANIGAQHLGSATTVNLATQQGSQTIPPGVYYFGVTSAASTLNVSQSRFTPFLYINQGFGTTTGGACTSPSITPPALSPALPSDSSAGMPLFGLD